MPKYPIELGKKSTCCMTESPKVNEGEHFPTLYLDWDEKYDLPDSGEMTIKFSKTRETITKGREGKRQSVEIDVKAIVSVKAEKSKDESSEDALDKLAEEAEEGEE